MDRECECIRRSFGQYCELKTRDTALLVCSCAVVSDHDIELALLELMIVEDAPLPTPGVVWRHLAKKMDCCDCAPLSVEKIYEKLETLEAKGFEAARRQPQCGNQDVCRSRVRFAALMLGPSAA